MQLTQIIRGLASLCLFLLTACVTQPSKPVETLTGPPTPAFHKDLSEAIHFVATHLKSQVSPQAIVDAKMIPVDRFFNEHSAEEATASKNLQQNLVNALTATLPNASFGPLDTRNIQNAHWVTIASYASVKASEANRDGLWIRLKVAISDIKTGEVVAQVVTHVDAKQFNSAPTRFYKSAPMYLTDASHQDRNAVLAGQRRPLGNGLMVRAVMMEATHSFEMENWSEAEQRFSKVLELSPNHTGALSGLYQVLWLSGNKAEAEKVFVRLSAAGMEAGSLSVKLLFKLSSTDFIDEADLNQQYQIWLRAIAQAVVAKNVCMDVNGHASASGSVEFNQRLSLARAARIVSRLHQAASLPKASLVSYGKGSAEMIAGTGTDDATDSIDRRVEFVVRDCK